MKLKNRFRLEDRIGTLHREDKTEWSCFWFDSIGFEMRFQFRCGAKHSHGTICLQGSVIREVGVRHCIARVRAGPAKRMIDRLLLSCKQRREAYGKFRDPEFRETQSVRLPPFFLHFKRCFLSSNVIHRLAEIAIPIDTI